MKSKIISFWSPVKRQGGCSTNVSLYASYLSHIMNETEKAVIFSLNSNVDVTDYIIPDSVRSSFDDLLFLSEMNRINSKEDILAYTHKISENLDILGTSKSEDAIGRNCNKIIEMLSSAYDYLVIDSVTDINNVTEEVIKQSDLIVICIPQDRYVHEELDMEMFENKKVILLSAMHNSKNELSIGKIQALFPVQVYPLSRDDKINQAVYKQYIYSYIESELKRKSAIVSELGELHKEIRRLLDIESMNITYEIKKNKEVSVTGKVMEPETKIIREYKFIKAKNNIAVINLSQGAGATFVSLNLAYVLKNKKIDVSVIEVPHNEMKADILNILNDNSSEYISISEIISLNIEHRKEAFIKNGIKFYINNKKICNWSNENSMEYISAINKESTINIYDVGSRRLDESIAFLFNIIDVAVIVIDPMPYKLLQSEERLKTVKMLEEKNVKIIYVLNKYIKDLNRKDIEKYLQVKISSDIPFISPETLYAAYYSNQTAYQFDKSEIFHDSLSGILNSANILEYEKKKDKKEFKIFKWRKK